MTARPKNRANPNFPYFLVVHTVAMPPQDQRRTSLNVITPEPFREPLARQTRVRHAVPSFSVSPLPQNHVLGFLNRSNCSFK
jgi:hypothetical protein